MNSFDLHSFKLNPTSCLLHKSSQLCFMSLVQPQKKEGNLENSSGTVTDPITEVTTDKKEERGGIDEKTEIKTKSETDKQGKQEGGTSDAPKREETVDKELLQVG